MVKTIQKLHAEHDEKCKCKCYIGEVNQKHHCSSYLIISLDKNHNKRPARPNSIHPSIFNAGEWSYSLGPVNKIFDWTTTSMLVPVKIQSIGQICPIEEKWGTNCLKAKLDSREWCKHNTIALNIIIIWDPWAMCDFFHSWKFGHFTLFSEQK